MLLTGTPVTLDRQGTTLPVERIRPGQTLWNPLTGAEVEVVHVLRRSFDPAARPLPPRLTPRVLPEGALGPGRPDRPLRVLPALHCITAKPTPSGRTALDAAPLADLSPSLVRAIGPLPGEEVFLPLPKVPTLVLVCGLLVSLDIAWPVATDASLPPAFARLLTPSENQSPI